MTISIETMNYFVNFTFLLNRKTICFEYFSFKTISDSTYKRIDPDCNFNIFKRVLFRTISWCMRTSLEQEILIFSMRSTN